MILFSERLKAQTAFHQWRKAKDKEFNAAHEENIHILPNLMSAILRHRFKREQEAYEISSHADED